MKNVYLDVNGDIIDAIFSLPTEHKIDKILQDIVKIREGISDLTDDISTDIKKKKKKKDDDKKKSKKKSEEKMQVRRIITVRRIKK